MTAAFEIVAYGVDDLTIGFDMTGSGAIRRLNEWPGLITRRGKMLGSRTSWGVFAHKLGRIEPLQPSIVQGLGRGGDLSIVSQLVRG